MYDVCYNKNCWYLGIRFNGLVRTVRGNCERREFDLTEIAFRDAKVSHNYYSIYNLLIKCCTHTTDTCNLTYSVCIVAEISGSQVILSRGGGGDVAFFQHVLFDH